MKLDSHKLLVGAGTAADCVNFNEFIGKNMKLYELNNDIQLSTKAAANYIRGEVSLPVHALAFNSFRISTQLATALRKGPFQTNLLLAGYDAAPGTQSGGEVSLYVMDYLASLAKTNYGAHGYAANFILSVMDREWRKGITLAEGLDIAKKCIHELRTRFVVF